MSRSTFPLLCCLAMVSAAPIETDFITWQSEPNIRGTWSILSSCVITLILCVYTAVHMNIPVGSRTAWQRRRDIAGWVLAGIFAPEIVVWTAWQQWSEAKQLTKDIRALMERIEYLPEKKGLLPFLESWTIKHSFFVIMGGYQIRPEVPLKWFTVDSWVHGEKVSWIFDPRRPRCVLTAQGLLHLLEYGEGHRLPVLTAQDIDDRSKASKLGKLLSCVQSLWLLMQIISRLASHLTITELEVNTLAHVICALSMYVFWMRKPLNIEQPVWLEDGYLKQWMSVNGIVRGNLRLWLGEARRKISTRFETSGNQVAVTSHKFHSLLRPEDCEICIKNRCLTWKECLMLRSHPDVTMSVEQICSALNSGSEGSLLIDFVDFAKPIDVLDLKRENMILVDKYELQAVLETLNLPMLDVLVQEWHELPTHSCPYLTSRYSGMMPEHYFDDIWSMTIMAMVSCLYGAIHASIWQHHFPTVTELWLWRISCAVVAGNGLFIAILVPTLAYASELTIFATGLLRSTRTALSTSILCYPVRKVIDLLLYMVVDLDSFSKACLYLLTLALIAAVQLVFVFSRVFLSIEAFISLRSQPPSAYIIPNWSQWLPHL